MCLLRLSPSYIPWDPSFYGSDLFLPNTVVHDAQFSVIRNCTKVGPKAITAIAKSCPEIRSLNLNETSVSPAGIAELLVAHGNQLEVLKIAGLQRWVGSLPVFFASVLIARHLDGCYLHGSIASILNRAASKHAEASNPQAAWSAISRFIHRLPCIAIPEFKTFGYILHRYQTPNSVHLSPRSFQCLRASFSTTAWKIVSHIDPSSYFRSPPDHCFVLQFANSIARCSRSRRVNGRCFRNNSERRHTSEADKCITIFPKSTCCKPRFQYQVVKSFSVWFHTTSWEKMSSEPWSLKTKVST